MHYPLFFPLSSFLFKPSADFFKGKTVFNHWLPGICYSNITFQLVSEATFNKSTLVEYSGVQHEPKQHRTGEENPYTVSSKSVLLLSLLLWGGDWSHREEGLCRGSPGSTGGGCCGYSMGWCMQTMQREIGVGVSVIKACFLENNFCFTWDILGLVLGINF